MNRIYRVKSLGNLQNLQKVNKGIDIMETGVIISPSIEQRMIEARLTRLAPFEATGIAGRKGMPPKNTFFPGLCFWVVGEYPPDCRIKKAECYHGYNKIFSP